ncbi:hypothetical protein [Acidisphaera sp. L21]|uniref:hypothetical protein n=1 Tax=Acidisphaera sp. L21 TaxID=1641851 RepID=UPI00131D876D|nr:hypothetical protein [Acidisphaera sp. L21]
MTRFLLLPMALLLAGAGITPTTPMPEFSLSTRGGPPALPPPPPGFTAAPTPDADAFAPVARASKDASVGPGIFNRRDQYRGEGLSANSSAQIEQDRRVMPGAGLKLSMPLQ